MRPFVADLHVHSLLSPCAAIEMTPRNIVRHAAANGIDIIAITDHNACDNIGAAIKAAEHSGVTVLPGMEVETKEEVHILVLFENIRQMEIWDAFLQPYKSERLNDEGRFGPQYVVDAVDELVRVKSEMLLTSLSLGVAELTAAAVALDGICIASHVDRPTYSIISQLGFIPIDACLTAVEFSGRLKVSQAKSLMPTIGNLPVITASDAHTIEDLLKGPKMVFYMEQPTLFEIKQALAGQNSRKVVVRESLEEVEHE